MRTTFIATEKYLAYRKIALERKSLESNQIWVSIWYHVSSLGTPFLNHTWQFKDKNSYRHEAVMHKGHYSKKHFNLALILHVQTMI